MNIEKVFQQFPTLSSANLELKKSKMLILRNYLLFMIMTTFLNFVALSQSIIAKPYKK